MTRRQKAIQRLFYELEQFIGCIGWLLLWIAVLLHKNQKEDDDK